MIKSVKLNIWAREFNLPIDYDGFEDELPTKEQTDALDVFVSHPDWIECSKTLVESYCKKNLMEDNTNQKKDNIFSYVKPEFLFVKRGEGHPRVGVMCKYRYDPEHGLAIVFQTDGKVKVGNQDIIL